MLPLHVVELVQWSDAIAVSCRCGVGRYCGCGVVECRVGNVVSLDARELDKGRSSVGPSPCIRATANLDPGHPAVPPESLLHFTATPHATPTFTIYETLISQDINNGHTTSAAAAMGPRPQLSST